MQKLCGESRLRYEIFGLRVFPLSLAGDAAVRFTKQPYNFIYTCDQLRDVFLAKYYSMSKKLNHKDKVNKFVPLRGESVRSSCDWFTAFFRSVLNHRIYDESLKMYFYGVKMITIKKYWIILRGFLW